MKGLILSLLALGLPCVAVAQGPPQPTPPPTNMTGVWQVTTFVTAPPQRPAAACVLSDSMNLVQDTTRHFKGLISGLLTCPGILGAGPIPFTDSIVRGVVHGDTVDFDLKTPVDVPSVGSIKVGHYWGIGGSKLIGVAVWVFGNEPQTGAWSAVRP